MSLFANYPGNVEHIVGEVKGPDTAGGWLRAVAATYDPDTDKTRVQFKPVVLPIETEQALLAARGDTRG